MRPESTSAKPPGVRAFAHSTKRIKRQARVFALAVVLALAAVATPSAQAQTFSVL
jgi:hypothetical protein